MKLKFSAENPYVSLSLKVYGAEVVFSQINSKEKFQQLAKFLKNPRDSILFKQLNTIKNVHAFKWRVCHPLGNGLAFHTSADLGLSLLLIKTNNQNADSFMLNNLYRFFRLLFQFHLLN